MKLLKIFTAVMLMSIGVSVANACDTTISSCGTISAGSQTVCLDSDIQTSSAGDCITISASVNDLVLDCQGHRITKLGGYANAEAGIQIDEGAVNVTVRDCEANGWWAGIVSYADGTGEPNYDYVLIKNNKAFDNSAGIWLYAANYNEVANNKADDNQYGIRVFRDSDNNDVHHNTVHGSSVHGIYCQVFDAENQPDLNTFEYNQVNLNTIYGIYLRNCDDGWVNYNTANRNGNDGIQINTDSDNNDVERNKVNRNGDYGIYEESGSDNDFANNVCRNNKTGEENKVGLCK